MSAVVGHCGRCESPLERGDLRCAICGLATPAPTGSAADAPEEQRVQVCRCEGCGAAVKYDPAHGAPACAFCGSVTHLEELVDPVEQTERYLPFRVSKAEAARALEAWLGSRGFFRPADLSEASRLEKLQPLLWVAWVFDARCEVTWAADSDAGARRSSWAPHSGAAHLAIDDVLVSASRGLSDDEVDQLVDGYRFAGLTEAPSADPRGGEHCVDLEAVHVESFDVQRSAARRRIVARVESAAAARIEAGHIPGHRFRNVHTSVQLEGLDTRRIALPAWVLAYRYDGKLYRAVVNGQDASVGTGTAPWSVARIAAVVVGSFILVFVILAIVLGAS